MPTIRTTPKKQKAPVPPKGFSGAKAKAQAGIYTTGDNERKVVKTSKGDIRMGPNSRLDTNVRPAPAPTIKSRAVEIWKALTGKTKPTPPSNVAGVRG